jgi:agmatinase
VGGDVMELAPSLTPTPESAPRTVALAARYLLETLDAALVVQGGVWQFARAPCAPCFSPSR